MATKLDKIHTCLFITANDNERNAFLDALKNQETKTFPKGIVCKFGDFGKYKVFHYHLPEQGNGAEIDILNSINVINPDYVVLVGIACGKNNTEQKIGQVLVSHNVIDYDQRKEDYHIKTEAGVTNWRGVRARSGKTLYGLFYGFHFDWEKVKNFKAHFGDIICSSVLLNNPKLKSEIFDLFHNEPIGYEMEGASAFRACHSSGITEWILVKGISDFGDGNKSQNKQKYQKTAAHNAVALCHYVFSQDNILPIEGNNNLIIDTKSTPVDPKLTPSGIQCEAHGSQGFKGANCSASESMIATTGRKIHSEHEFISREQKDWLRKYRKSIHKLKNLIELEPSNAGYYYCLGVNYNWLGNNREAVHNITKAIELAPERAEYHYERGVAYNWLKEYSKALCSHRDALALRPDYPECIANRAFSLYMSEEAALAYKETKNSLITHKESAILYRRLAWIKLKIAKKNYEQCNPDILEDLDKAINLEKDLGYKSGHYNTRAEYYLYVGELQKAQEDIWEAAILYNANAYALYNYSAYFRERGDTTKEKYFLKMAIEKGYTIGDAMN